jgi:hypothetical protein
MKHLQVHSAIDALNSFQSQQVYLSSEGKNSRRKASENRGVSRYKTNSGKSLNNGPGRATALQMSQLSSKMSDH